MKNVISHCMQFCSTNRPLADDTFGSFLYCVLSSFINAQVFSDQQQQETISKVLSHDLKWDNKQRS